MIEHPIIFGNRNHGITVVCFILFLTLASCTTPNVEITFCRAYGGGKLGIGECVRQTLDGGYIVVGIARPSGADSADMYILKADSYGNIVWETSYGGARAQEAYSVTPTFDGGYMVAGCSFVNRFLHTCLIKLDADGKTLWSRIYGDGLHACARSIEETSDRGYVIVGNEHGCGNGHSGVYAMKVDSLGNLVWENSSCECVMAEARSVKRAPDGGYVMMGSASSHEGASIDMLVRKIDEGGKTQWEKYYGGREDERGAALDVADGGYILAGNKIQKSGKSNICLTKTDLFGEVVWERTYEQPENAWSGSVRRTSDGGYVVVGNNRSLGSDLGEVFLMKTSRIGQVIWQRSLDKAAEGAGKSVEETSDGGFIITGSTASFSNGKESVCLVKTDSSGCVGQPNAK